MKRICTNKKCSKAGIVVETSFLETMCKNCEAQLSDDIEIICYVDRAVDEYR